MKPVSAGQLRHRVTINQPVPGAADAFGFRANVWTLLGTYWASVEPLSGQELQEAQSYAATVSHKITMRWASGIIPTYQAVYGTRQFNINAVLNAEERNRTLVLLCTEQVRT